MKKIFVLLCLTILPVSFFAASLKISLSSHKTEYILYEPLNIKYILENTTDKYLIIPELHNFFIVEDHNGNITRPSDFIPSDYTEKGPCMHFLVLSPHQKIIHYMWVDPFSAPLSVGHYKITLEWDGTRYDCTYFDKYTKDNTIIWSDKIKTKSINIIIINPENADRELLDSMPLEEVKRALFDDNIISMIIDKYPQSHYAMWFYMHRYCMMVKPKPPILSNAMSAVNKIIDYEKKDLPTEYKASREKMIQKKKVEIAKMEALAKYHLSDLYAVRLFYELAQAYLKCYNYKKAKEIFKRSSSLPTQWRWDYRFKASAKEYVKALEYYGK